MYHRKGKLKNIYIYTYIDIYNELTRNKFSCAQSVNNNPLIIQRCKLLLADVILQVSSETSEKIGMIQRCHSSKLRCRICNKLQAYVRKLIVSITSKTGNRRDPHEKHFHWDVNTVLYCLLFRASERRYLMHKLAIHIKEVVM